MRGSVGDSERWLTVDVERYTKAPAGARRSHLLVVKERNEEKDEEKSG